MGLCCASSRKNEFLYDDLFSAIRADSINTLRYLLEVRKEDINSLNQHMETPLTYACRLDLAGVARLLLDYSPDLEIQDDQGNTALMYAVGQPGFADTVQALIDKKANVQHSNKKGETPLYRAADERIQEIITRAMGR